MRLALIVAVAALAFVPQVPGAAQTQAPAGPKVQITFEPGGLVSLVANGATVREILLEWTRQGGSTFVNSERLSGAPQTMQFTHQPEKDVMASLLRQAAGYVLGPRRAGTIGVSSLEVVYILPTSNPSTSGFSSMPSQTYQQPQVSTPGAPDDELPPVGRGAPPPAPGAQPGPQPPPDYRQTAPGASGVAVPVVPVVPITTTPPPAGTTGSAGTSGS